MKQNKFPTTGVKAKQSAHVRGKSMPSKSEEKEESIQHELDELHKAAKHRYEQASEAWQPQRQEALNDLKFYAGDQWNDNLTRNNAGRKEPSLTVNRLPQFAKQIENELRNQAITVNVYPTDEIGSEETADIFAGIIRDIERRSYAQSHYIHAAGENGALIPGFGFLRLDTKYRSPLSDEQDIFISSPQDPFKIIPDPDALELDSSDAQFWFEFQDYSPEAYRAAFPDSELASMDLTVTGASLSKWVTGNGIRVVKYWYKETIEFIQYTLEDGTIVDTLSVYDPNEEPNEEDERKPFPTKMNKDGTLVQKTILRSRRVIDSKVKWAILNGCEVLDTGDWADSEFPFVSIYGPALVVDGERSIRGIVRFAKDSQKMLNYMASSVVRRIGSANKSPWIVDFKAIKGYERQWSTANTENWSVLPYNSVDPDNPSRQLPPPMRADQTGQINDLLAAAVKFENDLKSTVGIYDAGLGATPNEQSGVAIKTLAQQGQNSNYHFSDALQRAIQRLGYLLVRLIPKIYDTPRVLRVIGADSQEKIVRVNQIFEKDGEQRYIDLSKGCYGVSISAGPAYATKKAQALDQITKLVGADPAILPFIQDILVGEMDFDQAPVIQERLRKLLIMKAPQLVESADMQIPPQAQAAIAQQTQMIQQLTQELQAAQQTLHQLQIERVTKQIEHQGQIAVIQAKRDADLQVALAKAHVDSNMLHDQLDAKMVDRKMEHTHKMTEKLMDAAKEGHLPDITGQQMGVPGMTQLKGPQV